MTGPRQDAILVLNSGSSSLKAGVFVPGPGENFAGEHAVLTAQASGIGQGGGSLSIHDADGKEIGKQDHSLGSQSEALSAVADALRKQAGGFAPCSIGHRIVHGGPKLRTHIRLSPDVLATLRASIHFAPLHLPASIQLIEQAGHLFPGVPQVACFDTVFHADMPARARRLPIPEEYAAEGVERYGFHGLSYESIVGQLRSEPQALPERIAVAHLGSGSSLCGILRGTSIDTTMGLTPTGGIPMATRSGDLDPGVLFFLARRGGLSIDELESILNHKAGLAGISGGTGDMQQLERAATAAPAQQGEVSASKTNEAALAFDIFALGIAKAIASLTISLAGLDLLVFTGGIGQHSAPLRAAVLEALAPLGVRFDTDRNTANAEDLADPSSKIAIRILPAEEELAIAGHTRSLVGLR